MLQRLVVAAPKARAPQVQPVWLLLLLLLLAAAGYRGRRLRNAQEAQVAVQGLLLVCGRRLPCRLHRGRTDAVAGSWVFFMGPLFPPKKQLRVG